MEKKKKKLLKPEDFFGRVTEEVSIIDEKEGQKEDDRKINDEKYKQKKRKPLH